MSSSNSLKTVNITYQDGDVELQAYVAFDSQAEGPLPGVLVGHTAIGMQEEFIYEQTRKIASLGYCAFALDMFGTGEVVLDPEKRGALLDYFKQDRSNVRRRVAAAFHALCALPEVDEQRIAGVGYCFGGRVMLDLARSGLPVRGVVSLHGVLDAPELPDHPAISAKVLAIHGHIDPFTTPEKVLEFEEEMERKNVDWQLHNYGGTMHAFTRPDKTLDEHRKAGFQYDRKADLRSWRATTQFLEEVFEC
eukprot:gene14034-16589_t